jgi:hypothetical protein
MKFYSVAFVDFSGTTKNAGVRASSEAQVRKCVRQQFGAVLVTSIQKLG